MTDMQSNGDRVGWITLGQARTVCSRCAPAREEAERVLGLQGSGARALVDIVVRLEAREHRLCCDQCGRGMADAPGI